MRGLTRKGAVTGSLDGGTFTIRRARAPVREPRQRCHLLPWPSMAAAACWRKRKGKEEGSLAMGRWQGCGHVRAALLLTAAGKGGEGHGGAAPLRPFLPPPFGGQKERERKEMS